MAKVCPSCFNKVGKDDIICSHCGSIVSDEVLIRQNIEKMLEGKKVSNKVELPKKPLTSHNARNRKRLSRYDDGEVVIHRKPKKSSKGGLIFTLLICVAIIAYLIIKYM